ncbi:DUF2630 family protein [Nonomuraea longicatena]|uniref:DUF2630 family protein n=1 Tax=Nonomuraea longicatena TaxID=83682 RepID=A0ABP4A2Y0_9ACTN
MQDNEILARISAMVSEERELRDRLGTGQVTSEEENVRVRELEASLDQCWDLLRQRRARRDVGENPDDASARPVTEVEGYQQ